MSLIKDKYSRKVQDIIELLTAHKERFNRNWTIEKVGGFIQVTNHPYRGTCSFFSPDIRLFSELISLKCDVRTETRNPNEIALIIP